MSVADPVVSLWDGANRRIYLAAGVSDFYPIEDIYHEYRNRRRLDEELRKFAPLLTAEGNVPKGGGAFTPRYLVLIDGTKIVPFDETLQLNQLGDMITDNADVDPSLYDISSLTVPKVIFIKPSEAEIIQLNSEQIEYSSFGGRVTVDVTSPYTIANTRLAGNMEYPVNSTAEGVIIAADRGFDTLSYRGSATLDAGDDVRSLKIIGQNPRLTTLTFNPLSETLWCDISEATVTGNLDGGSLLRDCLVTSLNYVSGSLRNCTLGASSIVLSGSETANLVRCRAGSDVSNPPIIDFGGDGPRLLVSSYNGALKLVNKTGTDAAEIDLDSGVVIIDSSCVAGSITIRGDGKVVDGLTGKHMGSGNYNGSLIVVNEANFGGHIHDTWEMLGLDQDRPMTISQQRHESLGLRVNITSNPDGTVTLHRQP